MSTAQRQRDADRTAELTAALGAARARLARAAESAGRRVSEIELLPVTKFFPATDILILNQLGCLAFGESREQEAANKIKTVRAELPETPIRWHMVGRIQRNKARAVAAWAYAAHSVDSARLITALDRAAGEALADGVRTQPLRIYLQISLDGDTERGGVDVNDPELVDELCAAAHAADGLQFVGLMGIPPLDADPEEAFARLAAERERVQRDYRQRLELSAGMSGDLEVAVKHGSTCVRVGTALMGRRPLTSPPVVTPVTSSSQTSELPRSAEGSPR
ncbi:YggS family pyridoxal phosphate-dependent enzyme [Mycolicibacterium wolinskyi]|uniref:Pyridoxal phosphate homeostasis protein n=1 Tax=Mycolicibacterium wolinskyi TaxID=59750 RepID=A0A1X2EW33_9MYCO|nr:MULTISPECIES: YggS family pyridoxal phosphate-dependent enzyme [Mycolicibacterium]MCV7285776.1 YggS family pyridoxal phosphate-dependent enzyme [Mycolicibacterium wolinskyi]MCV7297109.1 YggS family pyridoxal phosphate-dependent enzyme [Mycolicibacterium goodii]ORX10335.1 YggS family pyridoxal phosphate enzyme [Mycolicibacterium wolinskyi]